MSSRRPAIGGVVVQSQTLYTSGQGAVTDIDEVQAGLDLVDAQAAEAHARRLAALRALSGRANVSIDDIQAMHEETAANSPIPEERDLSYWKAISRDASPELAARLAAMKVAQAQVDTQRAGHHPTLSLTTQMTCRETRQY